MKAKTQTFTAIPVTQSRKLARAILATGNLRGEVQGTLRDIVARMPDALKPSQVRPHIMRSIKMAVYAGFDGTLEPGFNAEKRIDGNGKAYWINADKDMPMYVGPKIDMKDPCKAIVLRGNPNTLASEVGAWFSQQKDTAKAIETWLDNPVWKVDKKKGGTKAKPAKVKLATQLPADPMAKATTSIVEAAMDHLVLAMVEPESGKYPTVKQAREFINSILSDSAIAAARKAANL